MDGLVVRSCTSHPGVLGSIPKREEPGKTCAPCLKYRVPHGSHPPRSLVCGGQTSPHKPRLVVSHSTCPPLSFSPQRAQLCIRYPGLPKFTVPTNPITACPEGIKKHNFHKLTSAVRPWGVISLLQDRERDKQRGRGRKSGNVLGTVMRSSLLPVPALLPLLALCLSAMRSLPATAPLPVQV